MTNAVFINHSLKDTWASTHHYFPEVRIHLQPRILLQIVTLNYPRPFNNLDVSAVEFLKKV